jgi:hypothetical protein
MTTSIEQMADRVADLMEARLRVRGAGLSRKLRRGGRLLPKKVKTAAEVLALSAEAAQVPKFRSRVDPERAAIAYDICLRYLKPLGAGDRRRALLRDVGLSFASTLLVTAGLALAVLIWRGYL